MNDLISRREALDEWNRLSERGRTEFDQVLMTLPSAQSKQLKVLASVLDGCPLTQPCDRMWKPDGWCKEHCKPGQQEPDAECWLRYAEVMAADDT